MIISPSKRSGFSSTFRSSSDAGLSEFSNSTSGKSSGTGSAFLELSGVELDRREVGSAAVSVVKSKAWQRITIFIFQQYALFFGVYSQ